MKRTTRRLTVGSLAIAAVAVLAFPAAASAATSDAPAASDISYAKGMYIAGYDEEVAAANGYQIVTDADGNQSSMPVTDEAKARDAAKSDPLAQARSAASVGTLAIPDESFDEVVGNCGLSYVGAKRAPTTMSTSRRDGSFATPFRNGPGSSTLRGSSAVEACPSAAGPKMRNGTAAATSLPSAPASPASPRPAHPLR